MRQAPETVRDRMHRLQGLGNIIINRATHYSVVTVLNWDVYQSEDQGTPPTNRQPTATDKKVKKKSKTTSSKPTSKIEHGKAALDGGFPDVRNTAGGKIPWVQ